MNGTYALVRYLPYPEREEFINVGVVVLPEDQGKCWFEFRDTLPSVFSQSNIPVQVELVQNTIKLIEEKLSEESKSPTQSIAELSHDLANSGQITDLRPCAFERPEEFLRKAYQVFVQPLSNPSH
jgi:hypothetical protein